MEHINAIRKSGIDPSDIDADQYTSVTQHVNKPLELRTRLGLTQTEAGLYVLEYTDPHGAQTFWSRLERQNAHKDCMSNNLRIIIKRLMQQIDRYGLDDVEEILKFNLLTNGINKSCTITSP